MKAFFKEQLPVIQHIVKQIISLFRPQKSAD